MDDIEHVSMDLLGFVFSCWREDGRNWAYITMLWKYQMLVNIRGTVEKTNNIKKQISFLFYFFLNRFFHCHLSYRRTFSHGGKKLSRL